MMRKWFMTGLGSGYSPIASGTVGSLVAVVIATGIWWTHHNLQASTIWLDTTWIVLTIIASIGCITWGPWAVDYFAAKAKKPGDPGQVVLDEIAGQWLALLFLPMPTFDRACWVLIVQFLLFRIFDIIKPPPARLCERKLPAGWGILTDDLAAAVYANIVGQIIFRGLLA